MRSCLVAPLALACCAGGTVNYAGTLQPLRGVCDPPGEATLTLRDSKIVFAPQAGALLLDGTLAGGTLQARLTLLDANKHSYTLSFAGTLSGKTISGAYTTPRCVYQLRLTETGD